MKIISWQTYLRTNPKKYYTLDSVFGRSSIEATLRGNGFTISNYNEYCQGGDKPKDICKQCLEKTEYNLAVYSTMKARDGHCSWIIIGYKCNNK